MKILKLLLLVVIAATVSPLAHAGTVFGKFDNNYGKSMVCSVDKSYAAEYKEIMDSINLQDHTNRWSATRLFQFFLKSDHGTCVDVQPDGNFNIKLPDGNSYVFFFTMDNDSSHAYFEVKSVSGDLDQIEVIASPAL